MSSTRMGTAPGGDEFETTLTNDHTRVCRWVCNLLQHYQFLVQGEDTERRILEEGFFLLNNNEVNKKISVAFRVLWTNADRSFMNLGTGQNTLLVMYNHTQGCLIYRLRHGSRAPLFSRNFLTLPFIDFVGFNVFEQVLYIERHHHLWIQSTIDVFDWAYTDLGIRYDMEFPDLVTRILGYVHHVPEHIREGDWGSEIINEEQVRYAAIDAWLLQALSYAHLNGQWQ